MRRLPVGYILLTALVTLIVTFGALSIIGTQQGERPPEQIVITVPIIITATRDLSAAPQVIVVTATPGVGTPEFVALPTGLLQGGPAADPANIAATRMAAPTIDPAVLALGGDVQATAAALPPGCILHTVAEGDTVFGIAEQYEGAGGFDMLTVNGLADDALLSIGQVLIVPLPGCPLLAAAQQATEAVALTPTATFSPTGTPPTATFTPSTSPTPSQTPSATLPPTATNAQVRINGVLSAGVITSEEISILNDGALIDLNGWTLRVNDTEVFTFPEQRLFQGGVVRVFTRIGDNTPVALYWDRDQAVLATGAVVTLIDADGRVQSTFRVP